MAFCTKCGKELSEGVACDCMTQQKLQTTGGVDFKGIGMEIWNFFKALMGRPISAGAQFVSMCNFKMALILIGIHSLSIGLWIAAILGKYNSFVRAEAYGDYISGLMAPVFTGFLGCAAAAFIIACALAGVMFVLVKIFRGNTTYKHMLCVSAVKALICTPYILAAFVLSLLMPVYLVLIPMMVVNFGVLLSEYNLVHIICSGSDIRVDRVPYIMIINYIVMSIILLIIVSTIAIPMCMPPAMNNIGDFMDSVF